MHIDPKVEPWLIALLEGVQNSNSHAEVVATGAYAASALVKALEECLGFIESEYELPVIEAHHDGHHLAKEARGCWERSHAALAVLGPIDVEAEP